MKAYKGFRPDMTCRGFQYEEGKRFKTGRAAVCKEGFHACEHPLDCFIYYSPADSVFHQVELDGEMEREHNGDTKVAATEITIGARLSIAELVAAAIERIETEKNTDDRSAATVNTGDCSAATNTGDRSAATNTGDRSIAMNTGYCSVATNTGNYSAATNTGDRSVATNTGDRSIATNTGHRSAATNTDDCSAATNTGGCSTATNTGNYSAATNTGYRSTAMNTGYCSAATNTGDRSATTNTGDRSVATNTGDRSAAMNTGYCSAAEVGGKSSIAIVTGLESKARGKIGCWLILTERGSDWSIKDVRAFRIDGEKYKADVWYRLKDGAIVERKEED